MAKKEKFKSINIWEDWINYWTNKMPEAFERKFRDGGTTGVYSTSKFIMDY